MDCEWVVSYLYFNCCDKTLPPCLIYRTKLTCFVIIHDDYQLFNVLENARQTQHSDAQIFFVISQVPNILVSTSYICQAYHDDLFTFPMNADSQLIK